MGVPGGLGAGLSESGSTRNVSLFPDKKGLRILMAAAWLAAALAGFAFAASAQGGVPYRVEFRGVPGKGMLATLKSASDLVGLRSKPPVTVELLKRRMARDCRTLTQALEAQGYLEAKVTADLRRAGAVARVVVAVKAGALYRPGEVRVIPNRSSKAKLPTASALGLRGRAPLTAESVHEAEKKLVQLLKKQGYAYVAVTKRTVRPAPSSRTAAVAYYVRLGPKERFGATTITGLKRVREAVVRSKIPWKAGDQFNGDLVTKFENRLRATNLFSVVSVSLPERPDKSGRVPMTVNVSERKPRTISAALNYSTDTGPGTKLEWEDRNLRGYGDRLRLSAEANAIATGVEANYRLPDFRRPGQTLTLRTRLAHDRPDAFSSDSALTAGSVERKLSKDVTVGTGLTLRLGRTRQVGLSTRFALLSAPTYFTREHLNDPLDPTKGMRLNTKITPYLDLLGHGSPFFKGQVAYSALVPVAKSPMLVFAGRVSVGTIVGDSRLAIPADERFYAGGAGSIRGYGYQLVGPLKKKIPTGGKSALTLSGELRVRAREKIDLIGFVDCGNAYTRETPDPGNLLWGAGVGVCYHSTIGPIRVDVAVPLDRRKGVDDAFQLYVTLGSWF